MSNASDSLTVIRTHLSAFEAFGIERIFVHEPLSRHCSWKIGGPADILLQPTTIRQLCDSLGYLSDHDIPHIVIGEGSNLLFADEGFRGVVIKMAGVMNGCRIVDRTVYAQGGIAVPRLARRTALAGLTGLEHTIGIPGTLGGLVAMNGGSLQQGIGQAVRRVGYIDAGGRCMERLQDACEFSYRSSVFLGKPWLITDVVLELKLANRSEILHTMRQILRERRQKFPRRQPNCGSVFKNHPQLYETYGPPGKVIEDLGLKGTTVGGIQISRQHANFLVNTGNGKAADVLKLIAMIRRQVHQKTGIHPDCEVRYVSPEGQVHPAHLAADKGER